MAGFARRSLQALQLGVSCLLSNDESLSCRAANGRVQFVPRYAATQWHLHSVRQPHLLRLGHVFQGRYQAILVEREAHLLEIARYVVLNPVRAGMVEQARDWPRSSYLAMVGEEPAPQWLQTDWLLAELALSHPPQFDYNRDPLHYQVPADNYGDRQQCST